MIRNSCGRFILVFTDSFGPVNALQVEARALLLGLQLGRQRGISHLIVKSDYPVLISCLRGAWGVPAVIRPIRGIAPEGYQFSHCYREGNSVADSLASYANARGFFEVFFTVAQLPGHTRGLLALDMQNFCNFCFSFRR